MSHKTKATPKDRQWHRTKPGQNSRYQAGGLEKIRHPQIEDGECRQLATVGRVQKCTLAYSCSLGFRRWRRLISPLAAVTRNPAVLSPSSLTCSMSFITSCGILTVVICDLAFFEPVAITETPYVWCISVYAKKMTIKGLRCISLWGRFKNEGDIHQLKATPRSAVTLPRRLTTNDSEVSR
ncbi:hypothetical protein WP05_21350 [Salmonella enterica subsp. arizonae]|nr:hypothetical protein [Salmonella enterica subsp. arizonae]